MSWTEGVGGNPAEFDEEKKRRGDLRALQAEHQAKAAVKKQLRTEANRANHEKQKAEKTELRAAAKVGSSSSSLTSSETTPTTSSPSQAGVVRDDDHNEANEQ
jgi:hypothetical protein